MWISSSWQCRQLPVLLLCDHACGGVESWVLTKVPEPRLALFKHLGHPGHRFSRLPSPEGLLSLQAVYQCPQDNSDAPVFQLGDQLPEICSPTFFFLPGILGSDPGSGIWGQSHPSVGFSMRVIGLMLDSFKAVTFSHFHSRPTQHNIFLTWKQACFFSQPTHPADQPNRDFSFSLEASPGQL